MVKIMKKSVYELEEKELNEYQEEFKNTALGKKTFKNKKVLTADMIYSFLAICAMSLISIIVREHLGKEINVEEFFLSDLLSILFWLGLVGSVYYSIMLKIYFYRWLKIKHNIEY